MTLLMQLEDRPPINCASTCRLLYLLEGPNLARFKCSCYRTATILARFPRPYAQGLDLPCEAANIWHLPCCALYDFCVLLAT
jgi:hypothetical protein